MHVAAARGTAKNPVESVIDKMAERAQSSDTTSVALAAPNAAARVMIPTMQLNEGLLSGMFVVCQVCEQRTCEFAVCSRCGIFGHSVCLGYEQFCDVPFSVHFFGPDRVLIIPGCTEAGKLEESTLLTGRHLEITGNRGHRPGLHDWSCRRWSGRYSRRCRGEPCAGSGPRCS